MCVCVCVSMMIVGARFLQYIAMVTRVSFKPTNQITKIKVFES